MSAKKQKSKDHTDSNTISNSDTNLECNDTSSDESLSEDNISTDLNMITDYSNETSDTDHSNKNNIPNYSNKKPSTKTKLQKNANKKVPNEQWECRQLVKTQGSTVTDLQPFYVLKNKSFIKLIHTLNPYYKLPSDKHVKVLIHQSYNYSIENLKLLLVTEIKTCELICDLWTACSKSRYIGVICHFINSNYELKEALLAIKYVLYSYDAINIKAELEEIIND
ncbi:2099_t:CDS:2 [Cetraspora pellucida]|uniref:2099_t:CDS:1 n=1 Tax=Cetraspora pellucida TaxID=1433469 RepID=A0ACA9PAQ6_9GLOM|nr:2099_t:CDS:2 [Cetraspora pellucida]